MLERPSKGIALPLARYPMFQKGNSSRVRIRVGSVKAGQVAVVDVALAD